MDPTFNFSVSLPESRQKLCKRGRETHAGLARLIYFVAFRAKKKAEPEFGCKSGENLSGYFEVAEGGEGRDLDAALLKKTIMCPKASIST